MQSILPIAQSLLVFDTVNIFQHPWQVSVSATISACLGNDLLGLGCTIVIPIMIHRFIFFFKYQEHAQDVHSTILED